MVCGQRDPGGDSESGIDHGADGSYDHTSKTRPLVSNGKAACVGSSTKARLPMNADLWEISPVRLCDSPEKDPLIFLTTLFQLYDLISSATPGQGSYRRNHPHGCGMDRLFQEWGKAGPFIVINSFTGKPARKSPAMEILFDATALSLHTAIALLSSTISARGPNKILECSKAADSSAE